MIDTINGATSSAIIYSLAETAKANDLKSFDYFEYLLREIPKHVEDKKTDFLTELLPWSKSLPEHIGKPKKTAEKWYGRWKRFNIFQGTQVLSFTFYNLILIFTKQSVYTIDCFSYLEVIKSVRMQNYDILQNPL